MKTIITTLVMLAATAQLIAQPIGSKDRKAPMPAYQDHKDVITGTDESQEDIHISIWPSPFFTKFVVELEVTEYNPNCELSILKVTDLTGQTVYTAKAENGQNVIDLSDQPAGYYLVTVSDCYRNLTKKILKQ